MTLNEIGSRLERSIVPDLKYSQYRYYALLDQIVPRGCRWLEMGCGRQMFASWMNREERELASRASVLAGIDLASGGLRENQSLHFRIMANAEKLPFAGASFDLITANMVVEHLASPDVVLAEARRILAPGGLFVFHTPNLRNPMIAAAAHTPQALKNRIVRVLEEERGDDDIFPTHYRLNTPRSIRELAARAEFQVALLTTVRSSPVTRALGPLCVPELLFLAAVRSRMLEGLRSNILAVLEKPATAGVPAGGSRLAHVRIPA